MDTKIFIIGHKPLEYGYWEYEPYCPIQVGYGEPFCNVRDNSGDSRADWNGFAAESTATWWIAKNAAPSLGIAGQCQYRRRLKFENPEEVENIFKNYDVICAKPLYMGLTVYEQYVRCHNERDIQDAYTVIAEKFPQYLDAYRDYIQNGRRLYYSNSFVLRAEDYIRYNDFLWTVLDGVREKRGWDTPAVAEKEIGQEINSGRRAGTRGLKYQAQVGGFLSERLWTMWVQANFVGRIYEMPYTKFEGV